MDHHHAGGYASEQYGTANNKAPPSSTSQYIIEASGPNVFSANNQPTAESFVSNPSI